MIPTKNEITKVMQAKKLTTQEKKREIANKTIERASKAIRNGQFTLITVSTDPDVLKIVKNEFNKAGWTVEVTKKTIKSISTKKAEYDSPYIGLKFSMSGVTDQNG